MQNSDHVKIFISQNAKAKTSKEATLTAKIDNLIAKQFPFEAFPEKVKMLARYYAERLKVPVEMLAMSMVGLTSGIMGKAYKATGAMSNLTQRGNLMLLGVGNSSVGKSISIDTFKRPIENLLSEVNSSAAQAGLAELKNFIVGNTTPEALVVRLGKKTEGCVCCVNPEAREILEIVSGAYSKNSGIGKSILSKGWSGERLDSYRIGREDIEVPDPCVSALFLTQPSALQALNFGSKDSAASGFNGRFIFFKSNAEPQYDDGEIIENKPEIENIWIELVRQILSVRITREEQIIVVTPEARKVFANFHNEIVDIRKELNEFDELFGKNRENAIRLSVAFAGIEGVGVITEQMAKDACEVIHYSNGVALEIHCSGYMQPIEAKRNKVISQFQKSQSSQLPYSIFRQYTHLVPEELDSLVSYYPDIFEKVKNEGKGFSLKYTAKNN